MKQRQDLAALSKVVCLTALTTASIPVMAQSTSQAPGSGGAPAAPTTDTEPRASSADLGEIIVTAQKRSQTVNKTSVAVTALNQDQLENAGVVRVQDLTSAVPSVQIHTLGPAGYVGITIRGISNQDFSQLGSPAVATYLDGVYVATSQSLPGGLYDLERMEVLRGPQGTTYGQNATGGNINVITADPKQNFGASADLSYGNHNDVQSHAMVNVPVSDTLAIRGAFFFHRSDGFFDNEGTTARNYATDNVLGLRLSALWTPSDSFKWKLVYERFVNQGTPPNMLLQIGAGGRPADSRPPFSQPILGPNTEPNIDLYSNAVRSRMDVRINEMLSVAYIAGFQRQHSLYDFGILGEGSVDVYDGRWVDDVKAYSNEININFDTGRFHNLLGVSQFHKENPYFNAFHFYVFSLDELKPGSAKQSAVGVFDQATFGVLDNLRLIGGVRRSHETQNTGSAFDTINCPEAPGGHLTLTAISAFNAASPGCAAINTPYASGSWSNTSWKAGLEWDVNARTLGYVTVTNGFKSGEVQPAVPAGFPTSVAPEEVTNYELGLKSRLFDNALSLRAAVFDEEYKDIQVNKVAFINSVPVVFSQNAGQARIYGTEIELNYQPTTVDHLNSFLTYTHATYTQYVNAYDGITGTAVPDLNGKYLPNAPEFTGKIEYSHDFGLGNGGLITPLASVYFQTQSYLREFNSPLDRVPSYSKTDLNLTYTDPSRKWTVTGFVTNLEDKEIRESANTALNRYFSDYLPPRLYGLRVAFTY